MVRGGEAAGGGAPEGAERGPGAEQPGNGGGARTGRWVRARGRPGSEPGVAGTRGGGAGRRKLGLPGPIGPPGPRSTRGGGRGGWLARVLSLSRRGRAEAGERRQVPPAPPVLSA